MEDGANGTQLEVYASRKLVLKNCDVVFISPGDAELKGSGFSHSADWTTSERMTWGPRNPEDVMSRLKRPVWWFTPSMC